jgi:Protein of unknown function (DUF3810)
MPQPDRSRGWRGYALPAIAIAAALLPLPEAFVERWYSQAFYPKIQWSLTPVTNVVPIALLDLAAGGLILLAISRAGRGLRKGPSKLAVRRLVVSVVVFAAGAYLAFLCLWGLNYRRVPLEQKLDFDRTRITRDAAFALGKEAVARVNEMHARLNAGGDASRLGAAFEDAQGLLGQQWTAAVGRPKRSLLTYYFRWAAIDGMTDPFFLEIIVNPDVLPFERPFVVAHEWSHLAGYADESEANFVAWLTCIRGDSLARYSGWLAIYGHLSAALPGDDRRALFAALEPGPRNDLAAIAARYQRSAPIVRHAAREVYDSYLKANRVTEGIASYDAVVNLAVGTSFGGNWTPRLRSP